MAKSKKTMKVDHLSNLPDELLVTILSLLPTHIAARTSILSRRFRDVWEVSPSLALISQDRPSPPSENFFDMATHALLDRNPIYPLLSLRLEVSNCYHRPSFLSSMLVKAHYLDLRHLTMEGFPCKKLSPLLDDVFAINSLRSFSLDAEPIRIMFDEFNFPSEITLTCLRSFSLRFVRIDSAKFNQHLSKLCSLEDLHLDISYTPVLSLSSQTIRKLKLIIGSSDIKKLDSLGLCFPSLESLHLEFRDNLQSLSHIHVEVPLLRKAVINLHQLHERDVSVVTKLLNCISHVEELNLSLKESQDEKHPISILLESGKDVPEFLNLEHLHLTLCFHEHNLEAVTTMLNHCPALKSLKLVHEIPKFTGLARGRKRKDWGSRLPRNADCNYRYAYFKNLDLEENRKEVIKLLSKRCSSKSDGLQDEPDPLQITDGPITRSRAKKIKKTMQGLVQSTWTNKMEALSSNASTFKMVFQEERNMNNLIQDLEGSNIAV